jgi:hypothetical protein
MEADLECIDDPSIIGSEILWRYVHPRQVITDPRTGLRRPISAAFIDRRMSVNISSQTSLDVMRRRMPDNFIAGFPASAVRELGKNVTQKLDIAPENPAHGVVCPKLSNGEARKLAMREDVWVHPPPVQEEELR